MYLLSLFILVKRSTCFGRSFRPSSGAQNCVYSNGICQTAAAICCYWEWDGTAFHLYIPIVQPTRYTCYLKLFIFVKHSRCFGRSFRPSSGAQNCVYSNGICQTAAVTCCYRGWAGTAFHLIPDSSSSCLTYTVAVYAGLNSWWWTGKRPKHVERFTIINNLR